MIILLGDVSILDNYGFRFFVSGKKGSLYGVKDLEDLQTEYFTEDKILKMSQYITIKGVSNGKIDLEWFKGYFAKEWTFRENDVMFALKFGFFIFELRDRRIRVPLVGSNNNVVLTFIEYIQSFRFVAVIAGNTVIPLMYTNVGGILDNCRHIVYGVGFNYIIDNNIGLIYHDDLFKLDWDRLCLMHSNIQVEINSSANRVPIRGSIKTIRDLDVMVAYNGKFCVGRCTTYGGTVVFCPNIMSVIVVLLNDFAKSENVFVYVQDCAYAELEDESLLRCFSYRHTETFDIFCKIGLSSDSYKHCLLIINADDILEIDSSVKMFYFCDSSRPIRISISRSLYNFFIYDMDFERHHGIALEEFKQLCNIKEMK